MPPKDCNQNPGNGQLNTDRYPRVVAPSLRLGLGRWGNTLLHTDTRIGKIRGWINAGDSPQPRTIGNIAILDAYLLTRSGRDLFIDSDFTEVPLPGLDLNAGVKLVRWR